jgi:hypothetical protein
MLTKCGGHFSMPAKLKSASMRVLMHTLAHSCISIYYILCRDYNMFMLETLKLRREHGSFMNIAKRIIYFLIVAYAVYKISVTCASPGESGTST